MKDIELKKDFTEAELAQLRRKVSAARISLARHPEFASLSGVMMLGGVYVDPSIPTAGVTARDEYYGAAFVDALDMKELRFVVAHENMHKAGRHVHSYRSIYKKDAYKANRACDEWNNSLLVSLDPNETFMAMPRTPDGKLFGFLTPEYADTPVLTIFRDLCQQDDSDDSGGGDSGDGDSGDSGGGNSGDGDSGGGFDEHDFFDEVDNMTAEERTTLDRDIRDAVRRGEYAARKMGEGSGKLGLTLGELTTPKVDWREPFEQFVSAHCAAREESTWRRPSRRFLHMDTIMPTLHSETVEEIVFGIDASGSMHCANRFRAVMSELKGIAQTISIRKVHLVYWDGEVGTHEEYDSESFQTCILDTKPIGGGGTSPACVAEYLTDKGIEPQCTIMLTDGIIPSGRWGTWDHPVLWGIVSDRADILAPVGKTIHIPGDE